MVGTKADIIAHLQREILPLQGYKPIPAGRVPDTGLGMIQTAFPEQSFPLGVIHEFISSGAEDAAAGAGFIAGIVGGLMRKTGSAVWILSAATVFPPALQAFGVAPHRIIFIRLQKEKEMLWAMEEALKCEGLSAVIAEIKDLSFTASRRLQLAVEKSRVTGFVLRKDCRNLQTTACVTRWRVTAAPSELPEGMPGLGFPCWNVELLKVRNGRPGKWQVEFANGRFRDVKAKVKTEKQKVFQAGVVPGKVSA